jgi:hypothetical protein
MHARMIGRSLRMHGCLLASSVACFYRTRACGAAVALTFACGWVVCARGCGRGRGCAFVRMCRAMYAVVRALCAGRMHARTHPRVCMYACIHVCVYAYAPLPICTHSHMHMHTHMHMHMPLRVHLHVHRHSHSHRLRRHYCTQ